uniref:thiamine biosynthesis protein S n=1 Tax=Glaucosphaera vacuolata TaxID=38265 RepID=UPI001FCE0522|nr:thiamine biosynthesis protein S [Glaucosphaera vacuolata]UNJ18624.1 thiamine biosynthesis protein S [Glaucosphaera vacuolata]
MAKISHITVEINGEPFVCENSYSLYELLDYLDFKLDLIIVEYNMEIIQHYELKNIFIKNNDKIEIMTIVGGGT